VRPRLGGDAVRASEGEASMISTGRVAFSTASLFVLSSLLAASTYGQSPAEGDILQRLERLERNQAELERRLKEKDERIDELESELQRTEKPETTAAAEPAEEYYGEFAGGRGFRVAKTKYGDVWLSAYTYVRYLNQKALDNGYTDDFGREFEVDQRNDAQVNKVILYMKGWVYDPDLRYVLYTWSANTSQGQSAQVVVAGYLSYHVNDAINLGAGISGLPTVRSNRGMWPYQLKVDHRTLADEYFRGSYTTGFWSEGKLAEGLKYKVMVGNNLSQLGIDAVQLDDGFSTVSGSIWWMPTTGEFGYRESFGDYDFHDRVATTLGAQFTFSPEDEQSQPGQDDPDNSQIRLSDGTRLFSADAFGTGTQVDKAKYYMASVDAGVKYRGLSLEGEYYFRWVNDLSTTGPPPPDDEFFDHGFQLQASTMLLPKTLQLFGTGSVVFGEYGEPWDASIGLNWYPFKRQEFRATTEVIYLDESPVGYASIPLVVGGKGPVFVTNLELIF
jgi:hypothetical protein